MTKFINSVIMLFVVSIFMGSCTTTIHDDDDDNLNQTSDDDVIETEYHEYVDLGLSVYWATCNMGANDPSEEGDYYGWGEIVPTEKYSHGYCTTDSVEMPKSISGISTLDAATAIWGYPWRIPTKDEWSELKANCDWEWKARAGSNGIVAYGYLITGSNGNSIFLPANDVYNSNLDRESLKGKYYDCFWTANPKETSSNMSAYYFYIRESNVKTFGSNYRHTPEEIRPVRSIK